MRTYVGHALNFRYPIFLDLSGKKCLVAGEGYEVAFKVQALVDASARVTYVNPRAEPPIEALAAGGLICWEPRDFEMTDLDGCFLVITDREDNAAIFAVAEQRGVLCNSVDDPDHCRFSFGSIYRQGDLTMAISTNGLAPALAVRLKEWLRGEVGPEYREFLELVKEVRPLITTQIADFGQRRELWYRIVDSAILSTLRAGRRAEASRALNQMIEETVSSTSRSDISGDGDDR